MSIEHVEACGLFHRQQLLIEQKERKETYKLIPTRILTKRTQPTPNITHIPPNHIRKPTRILPTPHARRRTKPRLFPGHAAQRLPVHDNPQQPLKQVVEGGQPVHPRLPEMRQGGVGDDDAAEGHDEGEEGGDEEGGEEVVGGEGGDELAEADVEEFEEH